MYVFSARNSTKPRRGDCQTFLTHQPRFFCKEGGIQFEWQKLSAWMDVSSDYPSGLLGGICSVCASHQTLCQKWASESSSRRRAWMWWNETLSHFLPTKSINYLYIHAHMYVLWGSCRFRHTGLSAIFLNQRQHDFFTAHGGWNIENKSLSKEVWECYWNSYIIINSYHSEHLSITPAASVALINAFNCGWQFWCQQLANLIYSFSSKIIIMLRVVHYPKLTRHFTAF
jgi:hypothetical protein